MLFRSQSIHRAADGKPATLAVFYDTSLREIGNRSIRFVHEMRDAVTGEVAAVCELTGVHIDRQARKSVAFTDAIRDCAAACLGVTDAAMA